MDRDPTDDPHTPDGRPPPPVLGLVGGVGSGKSTVARMFADEGCSVVDADRLGHEVLAEPEVREAVREAFGPAALDAAGAVDREAVGRRVFRDPDARAALERIVHPRILARLDAALAEARARPGGPAVVLDAALLLEKGLDNRCDRIVYIEAEDAQRQARAGGSRGWGPLEVSRRERAQLPLKTKRARADTCIDNRSTPDHTRDQVRHLLRDVMHR